MSDERWPYLVEYWERQADLARRDARDLAEGVIAMFRRGQRVRLSLLELAMKLE